MTKQNKFYIVPSSYLHLTAFAIIAEKKINPFPYNKFFTVPSSEFADNNLKFDKNGTKFTNGKKTLWENKKLLIMSNFSFSHSVFERLVLQKCKKMARLGKG